MIFESGSSGRPEKTDSCPTDELLNQITESPAAFSQNILDQIESPEFNAYLSEVMKIHNCTASQLIVRACLSKPFVYQVLKGERLPGRDVLIRMCIALKADIDETQRLLCLAQKGVLYPKIKRDAAILCCIASKKSLDETESFLADHGEKGLGFRTES